MKKQRLAGCARLLIRQLRCQSQCYFVPKRAQICAKGCATQFDLSASVPKRALLCAKACANLCQRPRNAIFYWPRNAIRVHPHSSCPANYLHGKNQGVFGTFPMKVPHESRPKTLGLLQNLKKTARLRLEFCIVGTHCIKIVSSRCVRPHCASSGCRP